MWWTFTVLWLSSLPSLCDSQSIPFLELLRDGNLGRLTQMATRLAATAAKQTLEAQRDELTRAGRPEVAPIPLNGRPSEMIGQAITNAMSPTISQFVGDTLPPSRPHALSNPNLSPRDNGMPDPGAQITPMGSTGQMGQLGQLGQMASLGQMSRMGRTGALGQTEEVSGDPSMNPNLLASLDNDSTRESLIQLAEAFLGSSRRNRPPPNAAHATKQLQFSDKDSADSTEDPFPTIRQIAPGADRNFGIPQGKGCLPFVSEFMQMAYGNCVKEADEKTWDLWGGQINNALLGGKVDLLQASDECRTGKGDCNWFECDNMQTSDLERNAQCLLNTLPELQKELIKETCKRGVERQQCGQLRRVISECDILGSLQVGMQMQRAIKRCDEVSGILDQNPAHVLDQVNGLIGGEVAQGFIHKFLG